MDDDVLKAQYSLFLIQDHSQYFWANPTLRYNNKCAFKQEKQNRETITQCKVQYNNRNVKYKRLF